MLRDAAVDLLMLRLGNRTDTAMRDKIIAEMAQVITTKLEGEFPLPWFLLTRDATLVTVADTETVAVPTNFLGEWEDGGLARIDANGKEVKLVRDDYATIRDRKDGSGTPDYYDLVGDNYYLRDIPDAVISLVVWYFATAVSIAGTYGDAANVENGWLKHASDLVLAETGLVIAGQYLQSKEMVAGFAAQAAAARARLDTKITEREESNKQRHMEG